MKNIKLVVFDVGGTIIEDVGHVPAAFEAALKSHGYSVAGTDLARWRGASKREVIRRIVGEEKGHDEASERIYRSFQESLAGLLREHGVRPVKGIEQAFARLHEAHVRVALTTGFDRLITEEVLRGFDREETLDAVVCSDDVSAGRPAPYMIFHAMELTGVTSVHEVANVGDTTNDLKAGYFSGIAANVGVLTGAHDKDQLLQAPHTHILESATLVPDALLSPEGDPGQASKSPQRRGGIS